MAHFRKVMQPRMGLLGAAYHGGTMMHKGRQQGPMSALLSFFASPSLKNDPLTITFQTFTLPGNKVTRFPGLRSVTVFSKGGAREGVVCSPFDYASYAGFIKISREREEREDALYGNTRFFNFFQVRSSFLILESQIFPGKISFVIFFSYKWVQFWRLIFVRWDV